MTGQATKMLVIDDDKVAHAFITKSLDKRVFDVAAAMDGHQGLVVANNWYPELILLDVEMPGKNGYEVCDVLKNQKSTRAIPVVFLSAKSSLRERMLGYEVGGDDFLVKPIDAEVLQAKVKRLTQQHLEKEALCLKVDNATQTALEAIAGNAELGQAIRYVEQTFAVSSYEELASRLFTFTQEIGLNTCVLFNTVDGQHCYAQNKPQASPLEVELMSMLHSDQRFYDFGCRTQINYTNVALLIKNMPLNDRSRYGRLKDLLPFVLAATDEKARILDTERALHGQAGHLTQSVSAVKVTLDGIIQSIEQNHANVERTVRKMLNELEHRLPNMGLEEDQENFIIHTVDKAFSCVSQSTEKNVTLRTSLQGIVRLLGHLTEEQNQIIDKAVNHSDIRHGDESEINNIELF